MKEYFCICLYLYLFVYIYATIFIYTCNYIYISIKKMSKLKIFKLRKTNINYISIL